MSPVRKVGVGHPKSRASPAATGAPICMQCVAQGAPFVGVAVTMLNRRNIKNWAASVRSSTARFLVAASASRGRAEAIRASRGRGAGGRPRWLCLLRSAARG